MSPDEGNSQHNNGNIQERMDSICGFYRGGDQNGMQLARAIGLGLCLRAGWARARARAIAGLA